ncbi:hypothetical protein NKG05_29170 [Oerskovia sp. M15]
MIDGVDVRDADAGDLTGQVALVAQSTFIFEDTVRSNVTLADAGTDPPTTRSGTRCAWPRSTTSSSACPARSTRRSASGLEPLGRPAPALAIARALVRSPRLLVLDDATSAVDPRVEQQILAGLRGEGTSSGSGPTAEHPRSSWSPIACRAWRSRTR